MLQNPVVVAVLAGIVAGLLSVSVLSGSLLALPLFYLTPLPLFIVGLGWGVINAAIAGLVAGVVVTLLIGGLGGIGFLILFAVPVALITYLALLWRQSDGQSRQEWYPSGSIITWIAAMAGALAALMVLSVGLDAESYRANWQEILENMLVEPLESLGDAAPEGLDAEQIKEFISFMIPALPALFATIWMAAVVVSLWAAGRIIDRSGRALRPWPDTGAMTFPRGMPIAFVASMAGTLLPGILGIIAVGFAGAFITAYIILGLVVIHVVSRRWSMRSFILAAVYIGLFLVGWIPLIIATIGIAEPIFDLRKRFSANPPPPAPGAD